jgi:hypothetical protein
MTNTESYDVYDLIARVTTDVGPSVGKIKSSVFTFESPFAAVSGGYYVTLQHLSPDGALIAADGVTVPSDDAAAAESALRQAVDQLLSMSYAR